MTRVNTDERKYCINHKGNKDHKKGFYTRIYFVYSWFYMELTSRNEHLTSKTNN
jgi:hypothetical protein